MTIYTLTYTIFNYCTYAREQRTDYYSLQANALLMFNRLKDCADVLSADLCDGTTGEVLLSADNGDITYCAPNESLEPFEP